MPCLQKWPQMQQPFPWEQTPKSEQRCPVLAKQTWESKVSGSCLSSSTLQKQVHPSELRKSRQRSKFGCSAVWTHRRGELHVRDGSRERLLAPWSGFSTLGQETSMREVSERTKMESCLWRWALSFPPPTLSLSLCFKKQANTKHSVHQCFDF